MLVMKKLQKLGWSQTERRPEVHQKHRLKCHQILNPLSVHQKVQTCRTVLLEQRDYYC